MSLQSVTPKDDQYNIEFDQQKFEQLMAHIKSEQSLLMAILGGFLASLVAAAIWATITYLTKFQIGFMAIGVGIIVGYAVNFFGKGISTAFGVVGAVFSLFGCISGNILTTIIVASFQEGIPFINILFAFLTNPAILGEILVDTFSPIDLLFYGIAVYEGFRFSFRRITPEELSSLQSTNPPQS